MTAYWASSYLLVAQFLNCLWVSTKQGVWCHGVLVKKHCWTENPFSEWETICPCKQLSCVSLIVWCNKWWLSLNKLFSSHECPIWRMVWWSEMRSLQYICSRACYKFPPDISTQSSNRNPWGVCMQFHVLKEQKKPGLSYRDGALHHCRII